MLKLCVIGAGEHSRLSHLPALAAFQQRNEDVALAAICDLDFARAREAARTFGFAQSFASPDAMLDEIQPGACLVIAPVAATAELSLRLLRAGCPVLVEKPLGPTLEAARAFAAASAMCPAPAMVSMNRRFDPMTAAALAWIGKRRVTTIKAVMRRERRVEPDFLAATGLHIVDVVCSIGGAVAHCDSRAEWVNDAWWWTLRVVFASGIKAVLEIQPTRGRDEEWLQFSGDGFLAESRGAEFDAGRWQGWVDGKPAESGSTRGLPPFEANGTCAETGAFVGAVRAKHPPRPAPADVLPAMELCHAAARLAGH
ncbi:MAG: Gfo/Idh/MocA family oxidoreductase [Opitutaceae bacterium]|jgi:predicted dehydrogenase|nr:Gfo/Idh/MocA family oxidoreductase [Opitutaceae bacterium]